MFSSKMLILLKERVKNNEWDGQCPDLKKFYLFLPSNYFQSTAKQRFGADHLHSTGH
jgi:hypothetical protein